MARARGMTVWMLAGALAVGTAVVGPSEATAAPPGPAPGAVRWSVPLTGGDAVGVQVVNGTVRLSGDRAAAAAAAPSSDGHGEAHAPGLLTLPARRLDVPVDRVEATVALAPGSTAAGVTVDIRGLRSTGWWSEWVPAEPTPGAAGTLVVRAVLPAPATQVQARLVLEPVQAAASPAVRGLSLTAYPAAPSVGAQASRPAQHFLVYGTREGLVGGTTANGHKVTPHDLFVALPSRRALSPRNTSDYSVKVCAPSGRCAYAPVWDVGPWNTRDDYWNPSNQRQNWGDLPRGVPEAQAARAQGYNKGKDQFGRVVKNPAGIDLADGLFWDALGLRDNAWVTVDYLWTGDSPLSTVRVDRRVDLRNAPNPRAAVVGLVADRAAVPVQCVTGAWLRIGAAQFLPATSVPRGQLPKALPTCG